MKRRDVLALAWGTAILGYPFAALPQQTGARPRIGFLIPDTPAVSGKRIAAFESRLAELGWVKDKTFTIEYRSGEGRTEHFLEVAGELVRLNVNVIVTWGTTTVLAAKQATSVIPIVFALAGDPVRTGLVTSLAHPEGNVTGLALRSREAAGKRLELLCEAVPTLHRLAILGNTDNPLSALEMRDTEEIARSFGLEVRMAGIRRTEDIAPAVSALIGQVDALFIAPEQVFNLNRALLNKMTLDARLPTMHGFPESVQAGALMSYGPDYIEMFRRTAELVDKILRGARPADIPVERATRFRLVINLGTAAALGLKVPSRLVALADEIIE